MKNVLHLSAIMAILAGIILVLGGVWAAFFTYQNVVAENIVTPQDASIPNAPVRGPLMLKSQADVIRKHTLSRTDGLTYAEMPRQIPQVDESGEQVLDANGEVVMVPNEARDIWITATTLMTALHLGVITYVFSGLIILFGAISLWTGFVFKRLAKTV